MTTLSVRQARELTPETLYPVLLQEAKELLQLIHDFRTAGATPRGAYPLLADHYNDAARLIELIDAMADRLLKEKSPSPRQGDEREKVETAITTEVRVPEEVEKSNNCNTANTLDPKVIEGLNALHSAARKNGLIP